MLYFADQSLLKKATRLVEAEYGDHHSVVAALKAAWNNIDPERDHAARAALDSLGIANRERLLLRARQECSIDDWLTRFLDEAGREAIRDAARTQRRRAG